MKTDPQLRRDVIEELRAESSLRNRCIDVEVRSGEISLLDQVDGFAEKSAAERAAGRKAMAPGLSIRRSSAASDGETWVSEVRRSLEHDPNKIPRASTRSPK